LKGMKEIVFMPFPINKFCSGKGFHLRKKTGKQSGVKQKPEAGRRSFTQNYFIEFVGNPFLRDDFNPVFIPCNRCKSSGGNFKIQLACKPDSAHHSQRVV